MTQSTEQTPATESEAPEAQSKKTRKRRTHAELIAAERAELEKMRLELAKKEEALADKQKQIAKKEAEKARKERTRGLIQLGLMFASELAMPGWIGYTQKLIRLRKEKLTKLESAEKPNFKEINDIKAVLPILEECLTKGQTEKAKEEKAKTLQPTKAPAVPQA